MDKDGKDQSKPEAAKEAKSAARARSSSTSNVSGTSRSLMEEPARMAALAASAAQKAQQRKMTEFVTKSPARQSGGAGKLPPGPCGLTTPPAVASLNQEVEKVLGHMWAMQEEAAAIKQLEQVAKGATGGASASAGAAGGDGDDIQVVHDDGGGWKTWTNRKNRRVGETLEGQESGGTSAGRRKDKATTPQKVKYF